MEEQIIIHVRNGQCKLATSINHIHTLRQEFRIRVPGAFYSPAYRQRRWDGYAYYITESGYFSTGLLIKVCDFLKKEGYKYHLEDERSSFKHKTIPTKLGKLTLRKYQLASVKAIVLNYYDKLYFPRGILDEATNAGKNLIAAALFKSYPEDKKLIFVVNRQHIYIQAKKELGDLVGKNEIGYIGPDGIKWNRFMICMAQSIASKIHSLKDQLSQFDISVVDEAHYASSKTYKDILHKLESSYVRLGMSGTPFKHKDKNKNEKILSFFGPTLYKISNDDLIKGGFSTKPIVTILQGNTLINIKGDYKQEETLGLIKSKERNKVLIKRVRTHIAKNRLPLLVVAKFHNHTELLYKKISKNFPDLVVKFIHVKVSNRMEILKEFKEGKIDILISSKLIKEGQNLPLIRSMIMACGGDSVIDVLQIVGRALRKHKSKKLIYIDDFWDKGAYLKRHSLHRLKVYKTEGFKITDNTIK